MSRTSHVVPLLFYSSPEWTNKSGSRLLLILLVALSHTHKNKSAMFGKPFLSQINWDHLLRLLLPINCLSMTAPLSKLVSWGGGQRDNCQICGDAPSDLISILGGGGFFFPRSGSGEYRPHVLTQLLAVVSRGSSQLPQRGIGDATECKWRTLCEERPAK